ncbi:MAG: pirin family protein [Flavobacteriales bacterium]|nr:pirin family protein [Flavobacteriales bacterium]
MGIQIIQKENQAFGSFNQGEIVENKPIGFPQDGGQTKTYSTLFYWAHATSKKGSTIGLHPHKGFEIVTYVIEGKIKHYDTKTDQWTTLEQGSFQVIKSGSGIAHSEELCDNSAIFQIWFDPDISKSLYNDAKYNDYKSSDLPVKTNGQINMKTIVGKNSPVKLDTPGISIREIELKENYTLPLESENTYSIYLIHGAVKLNNDPLNEDDFVIINNEKELKIECSSLSNLFIIESPKKPTYKTYTND